MIKYDLHTHSTSSDGRYSPRDVVKLAKENGVEYLALTDHDTLSGINDALLEAKKLNINFIPGIELSTEFNHESIHVLGFFKGDDYKNPELKGFLESLKEKRIKRAYEIVERLKKYNNIEIDINNVLKNGKDTIARPHIAKAIIEAGYPHDHEYIFKNILGDNCPAYVPSAKITTEEGIKLLKKYNALVFLAHPVLVKHTPIKELLKLGFDGLEAIYFRNKSKKTKEFLHLAEELNLLVSCGSDCHGIPNDCSHGTVGEIPFPDDIDVDKYMNWLK
ncbi:PHP domain-containing protein [Clostridium septicum]|uniref:PHP domain-containing protein n=1 Tax=Clostridium septicum TaxID=1504 RepID=A0A9N7JML8_CLOSE|nr:PHP domain-containing protein [Clostridium septicum]AYE35363.1 PHP domain-containing protein [Clostridium septicum]MDU1315083.1 PHP domain-containing protein [Clostridium septicum]QAS60754.1 PHP domain-containing protein [Clostridium septicum]UEC19982.1 PHP domain-containing protein [Clostridium septicum]USS01960.1 PHP domain-containing protein [Clostridium septicum]